MSPGFHSVTTYWANNKLEWKQHSRLCVQVRKPYRKDESNTLTFMATPHDTDYFLRLPARFLKMSTAERSSSNATVQQPDQLQLSLTYSLTCPLLFPVLTLDGVKVHLQKERKRVPCVSQSREAISPPLPLLGQTKPGTTSHRAQPRLSHTRWTLKGGDKAGRPSMRENPSLPLSLECFSSFLFFSFFFFTFSWIFLLSLSLFLSFYLASKHSWFSLLHVPIHPSSIHPSHIFLSFIYFSPLSGAFTPIQLF